MPIKARSGTELMLRPPWMVPTLRVGAPSTSWRATLKSNSCSAVDGPRRFIDGVDAFLRHRAVSGYAFRFRLQPKRALVADERLIAGRFRHDECADTAEPALARTSASAPEQPVSSPAVITSATPGVAREPVGERNASGDESGDAAFHVRRTAPVKLAVRNLASKRIDRPGLRAQAVRYRDGR